MIFFNMIYLKRHINCSMLIFLQEELEETFRDVQNVLTAQQIALEIVANICCTDGKGLGQITQLFYILDDLIFL